MQHLKCLTDDEKAVFRTFSEIDQEAIIDQAGERQAFVDQGSHQYYGGARYAGEGILTLSTSRREARCKEFVLPAQYECGPADGAQEVGGTGSEVLE